MCVEEWGGGVRGRGMVVVRGSGGGGCGVHASYCIPEVDVLSQENAPVQYVILDGGNLGKLLAQDCRCRVVPFLDPVNGISHVLRATGARRL